VARVLTFLILLAVARSSAAAANVEAIEDGRSPNGQFEVVNVLVVKMDGTVPYNERHFEIRIKSGHTIISQSREVFGAEGATKVMWRPDSRFVAIAVKTSKFAIQTKVFFREGHTLKKMEIPEYEPFDEDHASFGSSDSTFREPYRWLKNGDLVLDITLGHHTKSEPPSLGYYATVHFSDNPPRASKKSRTKTIDRD